MTKLPPPTDDVARLVDLIGPEATLRLVEARGGSRVYAASAKEGRRLTELIGAEAAARLHERHSGGMVKVPVARQWRVLCYIAMGLPRPEIARRAVISENAIGDILKRLGHPLGLSAPAPRKQLDLFDKTG